MQACLSNESSDQTTEGGVEFKLPAPSGIYGSLTDLKVVQRAVRGCWGIGADGGSLGIIISANIQKHFASFVSEELTEQESRPMCKLNATPNDVL
jgi:hypothetical protein